MYNSLSYYELYFELFWCGIMCMKQTLYKMIQLNFAFYHLMYYRDTLSYRDKNIMIIDTVKIIITHH